MLEFLMRYGPQQGAQGLSLSDSFRCLRFTVRGRQVLLDGRALKSRAELCDALTPPAGLNQDALLSGTLITPLGLMTFSLHADERLLYMPVSPRMQFGVTLRGGQGEGGPLVSPLYDWLRVGSGCCAGATLTSRRDRTGGLYPSPAFTRQAREACNAADAALLTEQAKGALVRTLWEAGRVQLTEGVDACAAELAHWRSELRRLEGGQAP